MFEHVNEGGMIDIHYLFDIPKQKHPPLPPPRQPALASSPSPSPSPSQQLAAPAPVTCTSSSGWLDASAAQLLLVLQA